MDLENEHRKKQERIEITDVDDFDFDGYQVVRGEFFSHIAEPCFVFNNNKAYVNTACVRKLPETEFVQILVSSEEKKLIVRPSEESIKDSVRWRSGNGTIKPKQITCKMFFAKVFSLMGWKDRFGLSFKEHQANLQVNIYNGYAVYSLQDEKQRGSKNE